MKKEEYRPIRLSYLSERERWFIYGASRLTLLRGTNGEPGRNYLEHRRGLDVQTMAEFRLGYVPESLGHAFSGSVVMPIFDSYWNLMALSIRPIRDNVRPKYWNEAFPKGEHLYGLCSAKYAIVRSRFVILVEGQMDVMSMHSHGFKNTVGLLGGAFTPAHALLLSRWSKQFVVLMDRNEAGQKHAERIMGVMEAYGARNKPALIISRPAFASLPRGDPDEFLMENGATAMRRFLVMQMKSANLIVPREWEKHDVA